MIDFIPEYSLALEKSIKGLFLLFEWIMHADLQKFRDVENKLTEQLQYKVEQVNFQREIKKVQSNMAEKEITYLDKIESLKFIKEKYETVIQMYEKELERREFDKEEDESIDINRPVKQNDKSFDFEKDIKSIKKSFMLLSNVINK